MLVRHRAQEPCLRYKGIGQGQRLTLWKEVEKSNYKGEILVQSSLLFSFVPYLHPFANTCTI